MRRLGGCVSIGAAFAVLVGSGCKLTDSDSIKNGLSPSERSAMIEDLTNAFEATSVQIQPQATAPRQAPTALRQRTRATGIPPVNLNGVSPCQVAGHITYSGTVHLAGDLEQMDAISVGGMVTFQLGDRTNNLNDCEISQGTIVDGTLTLMFSGPLNAMTVSMTGQFSTNSRGPTGGLVLRDSCWVNLEFMHGASKWTGSMCGEPV